jgi:hypothetical protein
MAAFTCASSSSTCARGERANVGLFQRGIADLQRFHALDELFLNSS